MKPEMKQMNPEIVSETEWLVARKELLTREKQFNVERDALSAARRKLPWVKINKDYVFDGPKGRASLLDLLTQHAPLLFGDDRKCWCIK